MNFAGSLRKKSSNNFFKVTQPFQWWRCRQMLDVTLRQTLRPRAMQFSNRTFTLALTFDLNQIILRKNLPQKDNFWNQIPKKKNIF